MFSHPKRRLRNYFAEPQFQRRYVNFLVLGSVLQVSLIGVVLWYFLRRHYLWLVKYAGLDQEMTAQLFREFHVLCLAIGVTFLAFLVGVILWGIVYSHRVAGAMFALKRTIQEINDGKESELRFRDGDEFRDIVDSFNKMVRGLKSKG